MQDNEQWLLQGDCSKCRKNNYCSKPCSCHKRMVDSKFKLFVFDAMNELTGGIMNEILKK